MSRQCSQTLAANVAFPVSGTLWNFMAGFKDSRNIPQPGRFLALLFGVSRHEVVRLRFSKSISSSGPRWNSDFLGTERTEPNLLALRQVGLRRHFGFGISGNIRSVFLHAVQILSIVHVRADSGRRSSINSFSCPISASHGANRRHVRGETLVFRSLTGHSENGFGFKGSN